jgi:apolipoprotein N-acyltransferase
MDPREALKTGAALGLTLPTPAYIFGAVLFGIIGLAAFRMGRKQRRTRALWISVALMPYPFLISQTWLLYGVGAMLCAGLWIERRH